MVGSSPPLADTDARLTVGWLASEPGAGARGMAEACEINRKAEEE